MKIKREQVERVISRLNFDICNLRDQIRNKAPKDVAESAERLEKRKRYIAAETASESEANRRFERIIKGNDLININYLEKGLIAARSVGRIHVCDTDGNVQGYGTGFMVAPGVLITNNHVLETAESAANSIIEFDYELDSSGRDKPTHRFVLEPSRLFVTSVPLDFTAVAVAPRARDTGRDLAGYGYLRLIAEEGKILTAEYVTIIQHPGGQRKQIAVRENKVIRIDHDVIWYATDTLQGSSGSPALNNGWQVVALHHLGVPRTDAQGNWLTRTGQIWDPSMDESQVDWIANEGIRVSRIVAELRTQAPDHPMLRPIFEGTTPERETSGYAGTEDGHSRTTTDGIKQFQPVGPKPDSKSPAKMIPSQEFFLNVPLRISVSLGDGQHPIGTITPAGTTTPEERVSIDPNYSSRRGYDPSFLGTGARQVSLPRLSEELQRNAVQLNDRSGHELKYHHFSVVMHAERRIAMFTAVNIDGKQWSNLTRDSDRWIYDPRIPREAQCGEELYARNDLDRGHLVRRIDPAWGDSQQVARAANDDTFHFTNCSPQHKDFNQGRDLWAGLEDYILQNADSADLRVSVFTGPVFRDDDREYRGVRIPEQFWKVIATLGDNGRLYATAYLVSQERLVRALPREFAGYGPYRTFQVQVGDIEALTGLDFGSLRDADVFAGNRDVTLRPRRGRSHEAIPTEALGWRMLTSLEQMEAPRRPAGIRSEFRRERTISETQNAGRFSGTPKTEWLFSPAGPDRDMRLLEDFSYTDPNGRRWLAPAGSVINGASIPRALWSSVGSPYTDDYRCASIVHDVACDDKIIPRKEADQMFYHACVAGGCSEDQARVLYAGVRIGAWASGIHGFFGRRNEAIPFRGAEAVSRDADVRRKFDEVVLRLNEQQRDLSLDEVDRIVEETLNGQSDGLTSRPATVVPWQS